MHNGLPGRADTYTYCTCVLCSTLELHLQSTNSNSESYKEFHNGNNRTLNQGHNLCELDALCDSTYYMKQMPDLSMLKSWLSLNMSEPESKPGSNCFP